MQGEDGHYYVVKFRNNPQHQRVLANEFLATKLAEHIGLPVPSAQIIEVSSQLIADTAELTVVLGNQQITCEAGLHFGSRYAVNPAEGQVFDYLPSEALARVRNLDTFAGILALDKWTCNVDGRQVAFWRKLRDKKYSAVFIDQGYCFNAGEWTFPDFPLRGVFPKNEVYSGVRGWDSFEPWLTRIEELEEECVWQAAGEIPPEWYGAAWSELEALVDKLLARRRLVRDLISAFRHSPRQPFPEWKDDDRPWPVGGKLAPAKSQKNGRFAHLPRKPYAGAESSGKQSKSPADLAGVLVHPPRHQCEFDNCRAIGQ
jgi:hypothetical protein